MNEKIYIFSIIKFATSHAKKLDPVLRKFWKYSCQIDNVSTRSSLPAGIVDPVLFHFYRYINIFHFNITTNILNSVMTPLSLTCQLTNGKEHL